MANNTASNITQPLARVFLEKFENKRVLSKNVDTQMAEGKFNASTGSSVSVKRPTDYTSYRNATGDLTSSTASDIITGKATATVQDYFTVHVDYAEAIEALELDQLDQLLEPMAARIVTDLEKDYAGFMMKNSGLLAGTVGTAADTWDDIAEAGAIMQASGVPMDGDWNYAVNPHTQRKLASTNVSLGAGGAAGDRVRTSLDKAIIQEDFAGMRVLTAASLGRYTTGTGGDRAGTIVTANPDVTYVAAKDSMTQSIQVTGFQANLVVAAGETLTIAGRNRLNLSTRQTILDEAGAVVVFSGTVTESVTLNASGAGTLVITGPAVYEAGGAYNTVDSAPIIGDVVTLGGAASTIIQPNMFWHKQAFTIASVPMHKLNSTDTLAKTADNLQIRVSKGSDFTKNTQQIRFDLRPAYGVLNPFFAGQGFGAP